MIIHSDRVDPATIGREWLRKTELQIGRMREAREAIPPDRRIDVSYCDMERDWGRVMRDIYAFLGMDIEPALPAMTAYMTSSDRERNRHPHRYSLAAFGLDGLEVADRFQSYTCAFDLLHPSSVAAVGPTETVSIARSGALADWDRRKPAQLAAGRR
jgi:hypothetical protein